MSGIKSLLTCTIVVAVVVSSFAYSVKRRMPFVRDAIKERYLPRQTAQSLSIAKNWSESAPGTRYLIPLTLPETALRKSLGERGPYIRIPFGYAALVYFVSEVRGGSPDEMAVVICNFGIQLIVSLASTLISWIVLSNLPLIARGLGSTLAGTSYCLYGTVMYGHGYDYHCTEAAVAFLALAGMFFSNQELGKKTVLNSFALTTVCALGCLTDWSMFLFSIVVAIIAWVSWGKVGKWTAVSVLSGALLVGIILVWQTWYVGHLPILWGKFLQRAGISAERHYSLIRDFFDRALGIDHSFLIVMSIVFVAYVFYSSWKRKWLGEQSRIRSLCNVAAVMALPIFAHALVLREHYAVHSDNALKFYYLLSVLPFSVVPALGYEYLQKVGFSVSIGKFSCSSDHARTATNCYGALYVLLCVMFVGMVILPSHATWQGKFVADKEKFRDHDVDPAISIGTIAKKNDLFFSPNYRVGEDYDDLPWLLISRVPVVAVGDPSEMPDNAYFEEVKLKEPEAKAYFLLRKTPDFDELRMRFKREADSEPLFQDDVIAVWRLEKKST